MLISPLQGLPGIGRFLYEADPIGRAGAGKGPRPTSWPKSSVSHHFHRNILRAAVKTAPPRLKAKAFKDAGALGRTRSSSGS
jgi:hypothetical protein